MTLVDIAVYPSFLRPNLFFFYKALSFLLPGCSFQAEKQIHFYKAVSMQYCESSLESRYLLLLLLLVLARALGLV